MHESFQSIFLLMLVLFGLTFGSFANVVIHRVPRGESIVKPRSRCPGCSSEIRWYDNLPVVSWIILGGRCRDCDEPIAFRYPLVEALSAGLWLAAGIKYGFSLETVATVVFLYLLLILAFIDLDTMRLPNVIVGTVFVAGLVFATGSQFSAEHAAPLVGLAGSGLLAEPLLAAVLGIVLGVVPSLGIAALYGAMRGKAGLGMGDVKLLGAMGPFLGPYVLFAFFGGSILGTLVTIPLMSRARRAGEDAKAVKIPFGPFLALSGALAVFVGPQIVDWYAGIVGIG